MSTPGQGLIRPSGKRGVLANGKSALFNGDGECVECCEEGEICGACVDGFNQFDSITVSLPAIANDVCTDCADWENDWVVPITIRLDTSCSGSLLIPDLCLGARIFIQLTGLVSLGQVVIRIYDEWPGLISRIWFKGDYGGPMQCTDFANEEIPFSAHLSTTKCAGIGSGDLPSAFITI